MSEESDVCKICGGSESSGVLGKRRNIVSDVDKWLGCDICLGWFNVVCLRSINIEVHFKDVEDIWICPELICLDFSLSMLVQYYISSYVTIMHKFSINFYFLAIFCLIFN